MEKPSPVTEQVGSPEGGAPWGQWDPERESGPRDPALTVAGVQTYTFAVV